MRYLKYTLCTALVILVSVACDVNSEKFPTDLEELHKEENTGGFLRIKTVNSAGFDQVDLSNASYEIVLEADDAQDGGQLESVDFYISFSDNSGSGDDPGDIAEADSPFRTVEASGFSPAEDSGLPVHTFSVTAEQAANALGISTSDFDTFDEVNFRWVLHMSNGKSFTSTNSGSNIKGGAFYSSPFESAAPVAPLVDPNKFVGTYEVTQEALSTSLSAGWGNGYYFANDGEDDVEDEVFTVEITVDPDNSLFGRIFTGATYTKNLLGLGIDGQSSHRFQLIRGPTTADNRSNFLLQPQGYGCGGPGVHLGPGTSDGSFDVSDDSEFTMYIMEAPQNGCGWNSAETEFTFRKVTE